MAEEEKSNLSPVPDARTKAAPRRRTRAFGKALLSRIPQLTVSQWAASDTFDVYEDMQGLVDLDSDAFLQPLEPVAEDRHG
jgi:hypothetical protein